MTHSINYLDSAWKTVQGPEHLNITVNFNRIRFPELKFKKVGCGAPGRRGRLSPAPAAGCFLAPPDAQPGHPHGRHVCALRGHY